MTESSDATTGKIDRKARPPLCPCPVSCQPIYNSIADDDRMKTGDLDEGYSGDCMGMAQPTQYVVGGQVHHNNMNHCVFTPLKGIIRFQINPEDVYGMLHLASAVMSELHPERVCKKCGSKGRWIHWIVSAGNRYCCRCYHQGAAWTETGQTDL